MSLLGDIAKEHTRIVQMGCLPVVIFVNDKMVDVLKSEREKVFGASSGKLMGMDIKTDYLPDGFFRIGVEFETAREIGDEAHMEIHS